MNKYLLLLASLLTSSICFSQDGFAVDESNFKEIFNKNVSKHNQTVSRESGLLDAELSFSYNSLSKLDLSNKDFEIDYNEKFQSLMGIQLSISKMLYQFRGLQFSPLAGTGFAYKQAKTDLQTKSNTTLTDIITISTLPIYGGFQMKHSIPGNDSFSVFVEPKVGSMWINQSGSLDGINTSKWTSFYSLRGGFVLFENSLKSTATWFDGITLSGTKISGIGNDFSSWSADLGLNMQL